MKNDTWLKLYRSIIDWEWFKNQNTLQVFLFLLIKANVTDCAFEGITIKRGEVATSYESIAKATGLSVKSTRTAINHLKRTGELASKTYPKFTVYSIQKYNPYQSSGQGVGQARGKQRASKGQQYKNNKKERSKAACAKTEPREWEVRLKVPETMIGAFACEQDYLDARGEVI